MTDFLPMERQRGITIQSAAITFNWPTKERLKSGGQQHIVNLIDTPGHVDFRFELDRCVPILDGVICVIDGVEGVEAHVATFDRSLTWPAAVNKKTVRFRGANCLRRSQTGEATRFLPHQGALGKGL